MFTTSDSHPASPTLATVDTRRAVRVPLQISGQLVTSEGPLACTVEDISATGARVRASALLDPGEPGILRCDELDILAEVRWRAGSTIGLAFDEPAETDEDCPEAAARQAGNRRFFRLIERYS